MAVEVMLITMIFSACIAYLLNSYYTPGPINI